MDLRDAKRINKWTRQLLKTKKSPGPAKRRLKFVEKAWYKLPDGTILPMQNRRVERARRNAIRAIEPRTNALTRPSLAKAAHIKKFVDSLSYEYLASYANSNTP